jgi:hypothetical protein
MLVKREGGERGRWEYSEQGETVPSTPLMCWIITVKLSCTINVCSLKNKIKF